MTNTKAQQPSVTVGIPAYNEVENIEYLLRELLSQRQKSFILEKIIVISDGSTDNTVQKVKEVIDSRIVLIEGKERKGQSLRQNEIIAQTNSDILVLLNADIALADEGYLSKLIQPIITGAADFTSGSSEPLAPRNFVGAALVVGEYFKISIFERWQSGRNLYTCRGHARAFNRTYYQQIYFPAQVGEDIYSYLFGITRGFRYEYISRAKVFTRLPETLPDYFRQSVRFAQTQEYFFDEFEREFVQQQYSIPLPLYFHASVRAFLKHSTFFTVYIIFYGLASLKTLFSLRPISQKWEISTTSKKLR